MNTSCFTSHNLSLSVAYSASIVDKFEPFKRRHTLLWPFEFDSSLFSLAEPRELARSLNTLDTSVDFTRQCGQHFRLLSDR